mgnify:CR=1 FL=1
MQIKEDEHMCRMHDQIRVDEELVCEPGLREMPPILMVPQIDCKGVDAKVDPINDQHRKKQGQRQRAKMVLRRATTKILCRRRRLWVWIEFLWLQSLNEKDWKLANVNGEQAAKKEHLDVPKSGQLRVCLSIIVKLFQSDTASDGEAYSWDGVYDNVAPKESLYFLVQAISLRFIVLELFYIAHFWILIY